MLVLASIHHHLTHPLIHCGEPCFVTSPPHINYTHDSTRSTTSVSVGWQAGKKRRETSIVRAEAPCRSCWLPPCTLIKNSSRTLYKGFVQIKHMGCQATRSDNNGPKGLKYPSSCMMMLMYSIQIYSSWPPAEPAPAVSVAYCCTFCCCFLMPIFRRNPASCMDTASLAKELFTKLRLYCPLLSPAEQLGSAVESFVPSHADAYPGSSGSGSSS